MGLEFFLILFYKKKEIAVLLHFKNCLFLINHFTLFYSIFSVLNFLFYLSNTFFVLLKYLFLHLLNKFLRDIN